MQVVVHWNSFVINWVYLPKFQSLLVKGKARDLLFGMWSLDFDVVALRVDFRRPRSPSCLAGFCTLREAQLFQLDAALV